MNKRLSVCMVLFNRWELSKKCIESIYNTVPKDWCIEWNVIDNGSTDETGKEAPDFLDRIGGVVNFYQSVSESLKQTQAVNRTMNPATGQYMLRTDDFTVKVVTNKGTFWFWG